MAELLEVLFRTECTSTHHKLALDALRHLKGSHAEAWRNLFLKHFDVYLDGSKAPDKVFKDFCNHVIHVGDNYWGGAVGEAEKWYEATVRELKSKNWSEAIYSAGVLSHYYTDPIQPLHTAQSEREGKVHRALEWSIAKSYDELREILEQDLGGYPTVRVPGAANWLEEMVLAGAEQAYPHYEMLIDHYDLAKGAKNPPAGLDQESKDCLAKLIGHASAGFAGILDKAFDEAGVKPPNAGTSLVSYLAHLTIPIAWVLRKLTDRKDRSQVRAIHDEVKRTGRALRTLPDDERTVRELHAKEVLETPLAELNKQEVGETGGKHTQGASPRVRRQKPGRTATPNKRDKKRKPNRDHDSLTVDQKRDKKANKKRDKKGGPLSRQTSAVLESRESHSTRPVEPARVDASHEASKPHLRFYLELDDEIVEAPSIGNKTAKRLNAIGLSTVADLLAVVPTKAVQRLRRGYIDEQTITRWQAEATLVCCIPNLRGHDAQILVGCELRSPEEIAMFEPAELMELVEPFVSSSEGQRVLRSSSPPDEAEVESWINWASQARTLDAAA